MSKCLWRLGNPRGKKIQWCGMMDEKDFWWSYDYLWKIFTPHWGSVEKCIMCLIPGRSISSIALLPILQGMAGGYWAVKQNLIFSPFLVQFRKIEICYFSVLQMSCMWNQINFWHLLWQVVIYQWPWVNWCNKRDYPPKLLVPYNFQFSANFQNFTFPKQNSWKELKK